MEAHEDSEIASVSAISPKSLKRLSPTPFPPRDLTVSFGLPFDPQADIDRWEHHLPHWAQSGVIVFATFRTNDSIPRHVLATWDRMKTEWMRKQGLSTDDWHTVYPHLSEQDRAKFQSEFYRLKDVCLDECLGSCPLRNPAAASIVAASLPHFDGQRYQMGDFVVMPNHVHLLAVFPNGLAMKAQFASWLRFTATQINSLLQRSGTLWQEEPFDHLVRSGTQYDQLRKYIARNPEKAGLKPGEFHLYRRPD